MCLKSDEIDPNKLEKTSYLGIDIGSVYFKAVGFASDGNTLWYFKKSHKGNPSVILDHKIKQVREPNVKIGIASKAPVRINGTIFDPIVCLHTAVKSFFPKVENILEVGASNLILVRLDSEGRVVSIHTNSLCAAGTGSFLDTQAARMGIEYNDRKTLAPVCDPPPIATRCAVFAKSDLVYRQQEGFDKDAMWSGLCRGLVDGLLHTLTSGRPLSGLTILSGGVALNESFLWWLNNRINGNGRFPELKVMPHPEYTVAYGAGLLAANNHQGGNEINKHVITIEARKRRPPLQLIRTKYPESKIYNFTQDDAKNEIAIHFLPDASERKMEVYLGIDVGSTSTKLVLIDNEGRIVLDIYRRTDANPVLATQRLFVAALHTAKKHNIKFVVKGASTTGSGRKLIGHVIGADLVINEISAHVEGAIKVDPRVETIFEIGGQDAKYMSVKNGYIVDANMNYVCAAGTGSFIEELASKLGYSIEEVGHVVLGVEPPYTSSRCTVFMEQDILSLLQHGITRHEAAGAVMYSIIENYLERVVGRRPISQERIFFQGATARNQGLVAAIENILNVEVVVSAYCHVMGAYGAAIQVKEKIKGTKSQFRGFHLGEKRISINNNKCELCINHCQLSRAIVDGNQSGPLWGMRCGREENDSKMRNLEEFSLFQRVINKSTRSSAHIKTDESGVVIIIPRALSTYSFFPFWEAFFEVLGVKVRLSSPIDKKSKENGNKQTGAEFCLPLKAAIGQITEILREKSNTAIFVPHMLADYAKPDITNTRFCPYIEALPSLLKAAIPEIQGDQSRIISPIIDLRLKGGANAKELSEALKPILSVKVKKIEKALSQAHAVRKQFEDELRELGRSLFNKNTKGKPAIVVIGRPYNTLDSEISQNIPYHIAKNGIEVIPMDCLPLKPELLKGEFKNLFWNYGQRIISALIQVAETEGLYAVYLSNYGCGPDSFLLSYAEMIMGDKPFLILEMDEHGSNGGYQTRVEAFLDVIQADYNSGTGKMSSFRVSVENSTVEDIKKRTIWFPLMHPVSNRLGTAVFRSEGYDAKSLPLEDETTFSLGKRWIRGSECLPMALTLGTFLYQMKKEREAGGEPGKENALFLPTSDGPCRFGQYRTFNRIIFDRIGLEEVPILSPGAHNAYFGLETKLRGKLFESIVAGDIFFKMRCRIVPYEKTPGDTEETLERWIKEAVKHIERGSIKWDELLYDAMQDFMRIPIDKKPRPLVGVVGEIYVRCNAFANSRVIESIEELGGEAWLSPVSEWILYTSWLERYLASKNGSGLLNAIALAAKWKYLSRIEHRMYKAVEGNLHDRKEPTVDAIIKAVGQILPPDFEGESILTLGRAILFKNDGADLVINCVPFGCMHGNITHSIFEQMRENIGIPVVTMFYDGIEDNKILSAFLHEAKEKKKNLSFP